MYEIKLEDTSDRHLGRILELQAQHNGDTVYLITDTDRITYAEANELTDRLASGFASLGVGKGDRVAFLMANRPELVLMCLALNKLGVVAGLINTNLRGRPLAHCITVTESRTSVFGEEVGEAVAEVKDELALEEVADQ